MVFGKHNLTLLAVITSFADAAARKSLSLCPELRNAHFSTSPVQLTSQPSVDNDLQSSSQLADDFIKTELGHEDGTWKAREDSYFDQTTNIWHLYFRQVLHNGRVEVADGDITLNVLDGRLISFSDSFYRGPTPLLHQSHHGHATFSLAEHCAQLKRRVQHEEGELYKSTAAQLVLGQTEARIQSFDDLQIMHETQCANQYRFLDNATLPRKFKFTIPGTQVSDPDDAALFFILAVHPDLDLADHISNNWEYYRRHIHRHHISDEDSDPDPLPKLLFEAPYPNAVRLENVPLAVSPVYSSLVYIQTAVKSQLDIDPSRKNREATSSLGNGGDAGSRSPTEVLTLAWKLIVELPDNHYEAYIDAYRPNRILKVVDWASSLQPHVERRSHHPWPGDGTCSLDPPRLSKPHSEFNDDGMMKNDITRYKVWPLGTNDPFHGEGLREIVVSPNDEGASPLGWHAIPASRNPNWDPELPLQPGAFGPPQLKKDKHIEDEICHFTQTWGNNVQAQENWEGRGKFLRSHRPNGGSDVSNLSFIYPYGASSKHDGEDIDPHIYADLAITQLFYVVNAVHDLFYRYGFTEAAGNFQSCNFGKGGKEDDAVLALVQDGSRTNNAQFITPPDGVKGKMRVFIWTNSLPVRDAALDTGIVIHELSHGLSRRLTGGARNSRCLGTDEGSGLSEGWGDFIATLVWMTGDLKRGRSDALFRDYTIAEWVSNNPGGVRKYPYSRNMTTNPSTYKTMNEPAYWNVHQIGEVWAQMLFILAHTLIKKHGVSDTLFPPQPLSNGTFTFPNHFYVSPNSNSRSRPIPKHGNTLLLQLLVDGMKIQPCETDFFSARDAILQADVNLTGGENVCDIWGAFASRGLGPFARYKFVGPWGDKKERINDFSIPVKCGGTGKPDDGED